MSFGNRSLYWLLPDWTAEVTDVEPRQTAKRIPDSERIIAAQVALPREPETWRDKTLRLVYIILNRTARVDNDQRSKLLCVYWPVSI